MGKYDALKPKNVKKEVWDAVLEAWANGLSDREAAFRASEYFHTTEKQIKEWREENADIEIIRDRLQVGLLAKAKLNIADSIEEGSVATAKWYLERKAPEEFSTKSSMQFENAVVELTIEEKQKKIEEMLKEFGNE